MSRYDVLVVVDVIGIVVRSTFVESCTGYTSTRF